MTLTTVLFVGGLSRRMGSDKATIELGGQPLWARQLNLLRELQPQALWISARTRPAWCPPEIEVVIDVPPSRGPLTGLAAALSRLNTSHLLALAVDLPQMTSVELRKLWSLASPGHGVIPAIGENFEPLCAIYPVEAATLTASALDGTNFSLQNLSQILILGNYLESYPLTEPEKPLFFNANSPADLRTFRRA